MRTKWVCLLLFALPPAILAGCGEYAPEPAGRGGAIDFRIGFAAGSASRVVTDAGVKSLWEDGDQVGLFVVKHGEEIVADDIVTLSYSGGEWTASKELTWPKDGGALDFFAYYPCPDDPDFDPDTIDLTVEADQSGEGYSASMFMRAENVGDGEGLKEGTEEAPTTVTLVFKHSLAMVQLTLDASMIPNKSGALPVVTQRGLTPAITMHGVGGGAGDAPGEYVYRALVPPGAIAGGVRMFRVELDGRVFVSEPLAGSLELSGGRVETFGLSLVLDDYDYSSEISDPGFESYFHIYLDSNDDGQLSYDEIMAITEIGVMEWEIESMEGIRYFKNLVKLDCGINYIRELDLTGLTKLETLWCSYNELEELDVTGLPALKELRCDGNLITRLDLSANSAIESVWCGNVGSPEMVVVVDPDLDLSSVSVFALDALGGGLTRITEREVAVNGVTVVNKQ